MEKEESFFQSARSKLIFGLLLVVFYLAGGIGIRWLYDYRHTIIGSWLYPSLLVVFVMVTVALVVIGSGIWMKSRNSPITSSDDSEAKLESQEDDEGKEEKPLQKEKARLQKVWAEIWERIKIEGPAFVVLLLLLHALMLWWFPVEFKHIGSMSAYWVAIIVVSATFLLRKMFQEFPGLKVLGTIVLLVVAAGFIKQGIGEYKEAKGKGGNSSAGQLASGLYPLPEEMPLDTSFAVVITRDVITPTIVTPPFYRIWITSLSPAHCFDLINELGEKYEYCPGKRVEVPDLQQTTLVAREKQTKVKIRLCDWRVRIVGQLDCPIPISEDQNYPVREINYGLVSQNSN